MNSIAFKYSIDNYEAQWGATPWSFLKGSNHILIGKHRTAAAADAADSATAADAPKESFQQ